MQGFAAVLRRLGRLVHELRTDFKFSSGQERTSFKFLTDLMIYYIIGRIVYCHGCICEYTRAIAAHEAVAEVENEY